MEMVLQYLWKHRMLGDRLRTTDGRRVIVHYAGRHNTDAGPDFCGARLSIGGEEWAGNIEIHVKASDWHRHRHDTDKAYDNVILHLVNVNDTEVATSTGRKIAQAEVSYPAAFTSLYSRLAEHIGDFRCEHAIGSLAPLTVTDWQGSLSVERMQQKASRILDTVKALDNDWEWACFTTLARALGSGLNSEPLEMTARSIPLRILHKHSDDAMQLEAILLGQAGLLDTSAHIFDEYYQRLCREYIFLAHKYGLKPLRRDLWKLSKTRPQNFPTRRIAMLANLATGGFSMLSAILSRDFSIESTKHLFDRQLGEYWGHHYDFGTEGSNLPRFISAQHRILLTINFVAPILYAYGMSHNDYDMTERAMGLWEQAPAENNRYVRRWHNAGIDCTCAADSQAIIQLSREYCERGRCMECRFGHSLLRKAMEP